jgi:hypothetical protein
MRVPGGLCPFNFGIPSHFDSLSKTPQVTRLADEGAKSSDFCGGGLVAGLALFFVSMDTIGFFPGDTEAGVSESIQL